MFTRSQNTLSRATLLSILTILAAIIIGCGDSNDNFVNTTTNNNTGNGNLVFNFVRAQGVINVPINTVTLDFKFFDGLAQQGNVTLERTEPFAASVTITNVPSGTQSYRIVARDATGRPLAQTTGNATVPLGQTSIVDLTQAVTTPVTLDAVTATPDGNIVAISGTQQFVLTGTFSNGETVALSDATWVSDNPTLASIDNTSGLATGQQIGAVTITGTSGTSADSAALTVTAADIANTPLNVYVSGNGDTNRGEVGLFDALTNLIDTIGAGSNQGLALDKLGNIFHNEDDPSDHVHLLSANSPFNDLNPLFDRVLDLDNMGLPPTTAIKGSDLAQRFGILIMADFGNSSLLGLGTASCGDTLAGQLPTAAPPWDVAYHGDTDRLFVAFTNGTVGVYDNFLTTLPNLPTRIIDATELDNAHGISYDSDTDTLIVSDVGPITTGPNTDGQIFVIANASTANGVVTPQAIIGGPATLLGNPVDIDLQGPDLRVAEKTNDQILIFSQILTSSGGDIAPALATAELKPESITSEVIAETAPDNSDIDGGIIVQDILVSTNPGTPVDSELLRISPTLTGGAAAFQPFVGSDGESVKVDGQGDVFYTDDINGLCHFGRIASGIRDVAPASNPALDHIFFTPLSQAKGLDVVESASLIMVADNGNPGIVLFGKYGNGDPFAATGSPIPPWDLDYDPIADRLFVALTDGTVAVFDNYLDGNPDNAVPDRIITVVGADNLHGIVHDAANDVLLLSDVGSVTTGPNSDGSLYVINNANTANGNVTPAITITGPSTNLGNPVDVAYDGTNLFVAEKTNDLVMRFDNIRTSPGGDVTPSASFPVDGPESISLITGLQPLPSVLLP